MKKATKIIAVVLIMLTLVLGISTISSADSVDPGQIANGLHGTTSDAQEDITGIGNQIIGIITTVGVVVAVVILLVLGIKYMMGSAEEKAEYKKTMIPYIIGAVLIFAASNVAGMIYDWASTIK